MQRNIAVYSLVYTFTKYLLSKVQLAALIKFIGAGSDALYIRKLKDVYILAIPVATCIIIQVYIVIVRYYVI